jgi:hypothetical protein
MIVLSSCDCGVVVSFASSKGTFPCFRGSNQQHVRARVRGPETAALPHRGVNLHHVNLIHAIQSKLRKNFSSLRSQITHPLAGSSQSATVDLPGRHVHSTRSRRLQRLQCCCEHAASTAHMASYLKPILSPLVINIDAHHEDMR